MGELYQKLEKVLRDKVETGVNRYFFNQSSCVNNGKFLRQVVLDLIQEYESKTLLVAERQMVLEKCKGDVNRLILEHEIGINRDCMKYEDILVQTRILEYKVSYYNKILQGSENELNDRKFQEVNMSMILEKNQESLKTRLEQKEVLCAENRDIDTNSENLGLNCEDLKNDLTKLEQELIEFEKSVEDLSIKKAGLETGISEYEKGLDRLKKDCDELKKECEVAKVVKECEKRTEKCVICLQPELGRMKKCKECEVVVHAKCTKEVKFVCGACKGYY